MQQYKYSSLPAAGIKQEQQNKNQNDKKALSANFLSQLKHLQDLLKESMLDAAEAEYGGKANEKDSDK